jgi:hypothetical protein
MLKLREVLPYIAPIFLGGVLYTSSREYLPESGSLTYETRYGDYKVEYEIVWFSAAGGEERELRLKRWVSKETKVYDEIALILHRAPTFEVWWQKPRWTARAIVRSILSWADNSHYSYTNYVRMIEFRAWWKQILEKLVKVRDKTKEVEDVFKLIAQALAPRAFFAFDEYYVYIKSLDEPEIAYKTRSWTKDLGIAYEELRKAGKL